MNRADQLTDRLFDQALTDAEAIELESTLATDPSAQTRHLAAVRLELTLRGQRREFDFAGPTIARIEAEQSERVERTTAAVMHEISRSPSPNWRRAARPTRVRIAIAALAAATLVAVAFGLHTLTTPTTPAMPIMQPPNSPPDGRPTARLTRVTGSVELLDDAGANAARPDQSFAPGQMLRTVGEESSAVLEFADRTRVEIHPESEVQFVSGPAESDPAADSAATLFLVHGHITATASDRRFVVAAAATEVEVTRGSFSLWSAGADAARVESTDGDVRVSRSAPVEPMVLGPGRAAYVPDDHSFVQIENGWLSDAEPRSRLDFAALDVGFVTGGDVVAVTAKQWTRWTPGADDPGRTPFAPAVWNDGLAAWFTPDRRFVALCRTDDRAERITVRELPSGVERGQIPVRVQEPRYLCVAPDASWVATARGRKPSNRQVQIWDVASGSERFVLDFPNSVTSLAASPDGRTLAVGVTDLGRSEGNAVVLFDATSGDRLYALEPRRKGINTLAFTADGRRLAIGFNGAIQLWDVAGQKLQRTFAGFERAVARIAFSPRGDRIAAGTHDGQVWVWSATTGRRIQVVDTGSRGVRSLAFSEDGKLLVTATNRAAVAVWDVAPEPTGPDA